MIVLQYRCRNSVGYLEASIPLRLDFKSIKVEELRAPLLSRGAKEQIYVFLWESESLYWESEEREREGGETERERQRGGGSI
jgi:hypothetical protein